MATHERAHVCQIKSEADMLRVRQLLRETTRALSLVDQTKFITAGSELARNILKYAGPAGGCMELELLEQGCKRGVRAVFRDEGPGIDDIELAMTDGHSSGGSLGLGLPGARRLVDAFSISSVVGSGTTVSITKWIK